MSNLQKRILENLRLQEQYNRGSYNVLLNGFGLCPIVEIRNYGKANECYAWLYDTDTVIKNSNDGTDVLGNVEEAKTHIAKFLMRFSDVCQAVTY